MAFNPTPELKRGMCFIGLILAWLVYLCFEPFSALMTAAFLVAAVVISLKNFS
jgi:hypothetical protein